MEDEWLWYLSGAVDSIANIGINIKKDDRLDIGFAFEPEIRISRPTEDNPLLGALDEYAEQTAVKYYIAETGSVNFVIGNRESIKNFLEPLIGGFVQQRERAEIFLDDILPKFEDGMLTTEDEIIEVMKIVHELRSYPIQKGNSKYTLAYFQDEFS